MKESPTLGIVVPCYNEEAVIGETISQLSKIMKEMMDEGLVSQASFLMFVNDGSRDRTWELIEENRKSNPLVSGVKLSGNVGHQNALLAGLMTAKELADCVISIDADLQDDVKAIREFVVKYKEEGCEIVYGVRQSRKTDTFFKRTTAQGFYRFMDRMGVKVTYNHADYRLMSKRALHELERFKEVNLFLRGIVPMIGFKTGIVFYDRLDRFAGESKYPLPKMLAFAFEGITSLSVRPIRFVTLMGFGLSLVSLFAVIYAVASKLLGNTVSGWTSLILSVWFLGGVQLLALGLIGEYIGKIYKEVKRRPLYIVDRLLLPESLPQREADLGHARGRSLNVQP
ncbi:glycosyltransferase family 2 protein [Paenibacillus mendelii]|uniref:Glycosyltransferase family 2 protein n=1 Tax=Paenibacillus mendelii TaxID=206163 RepID=A0ABV6J8F5_9BACL|nr:glycosyltransferase family 2 protein [Paenibacillus mendelii]MCQ6559475.1 glycosyltransferase family 2 protein [Paenibacillus mendelii]